MDEFPRFQADKKITYPTMWLFRGPICLWLVPNPRYASRHVCACGQTFLSLNPSQGWRLPTWLGACMRLLLITRRRLGVVSISKREGGKHKKRKSLTTWTQTHLHNITRIPTPSHSFSSTVFPPTRTKPSKHARLLHVPMLSMLQHSSQEPRHICHSISQRRQAHHKKGLRTPEKLGKQRLYGLRSGRSDMEHLGSTNGR
ncbi:hypothetical protein V8F06_007922 [Rhypophila decipiens]